MVEFHAARDLLPRRCRRCRSGSFARKHAAGGLIVRPEAIDMADHDRARRVWDNDAAVVALHKTRSGKMAIKEVAG